MNFTLKPFDFEATRSPDTVFFSRYEPKFLYQSIEGVLKDKDVEMIAKPSKLKLEF